MASSAYAAANCIARDPDWFLLKLHEELGELTQMWNKLNCRSRRGDMSDSEMATALANEAADVLGHVLLFAGQNRIDLASAIERKWRFRPEP